MSSFVKILNFPGEISIKLNVIAVPCTGQREIMARIGLVLEWFQQWTSCDKLTLTLVPRRPRTGFVYAATLLTWQAWFLFTEANSGVWEKGGETQTTDETVPRPSGAGQGTALLGFSKLGRSRSRGGVLP